MASSTSTSGNRLVLFAVVGVFVLALAVALLGGDGSEVDGFVLDEVSVPVVEAGAGTSPTATGDALLDDGEVTVPVAGEPTLVVFLAHWCPACNAELPVLEDWLADGGLPEGVALRAVATGIDPARDNFPPTTWLGDRDWDVPTLVDRDDVVATAFGLQSYPYWVAVDAVGDVVQAGSGQLEPAQLDALAALVVP